MNRRFIAPLAWGLACLLVAYISRGRTFAADAAARFDARQDSPPTAKAPPAPAVESAQPATPDCRQLFESSLKAILAMKSGAYEARRFGTGLVEDKVPKMRGSVTFAPIGEEDPVGAKIQIRGGYGDEGKSNPFSLAYDGSRFAILFEKDQVVFEGDPREQRNLIRREEVRLLLKDFFPGKHQFEHALKADTYKYEGRQDVEGVACDVVFTVFEPEKSKALPIFSENRETFRARWFLGVDDHLPRRIEWKALRIPDIGGEQGEAGAVMVLSNLKVNVPLDEHTFDLPKAQPSDPAKAPAAAPGTKEKVKPEGEGKPERGVPEDVATPSSQALPPQLDVPAPDDGTGRKPRKKDRLEEGQPAPDWELAGLTGGTYRLSDFRGKVVLLDFWATWCKPCLMAMPGIDQIHQSYKDKGVVVIGMNVENKTVAEDFVRQKPGGYLQLAEAGPVSRDYRMFGLPGFVVIDTKGVVALRMSGWGPDAQKRITDAIDTAVKSAGAPSAAAPPVGAGPAAPPGLNLDRAAG